MSDEIVVDHEATLAAVSAEAEELRASLAEAQLRIEDLEVEVEAQKCGVADAEASLGTAIAALTFYANEKNWQARLLSTAPDDGPNPGAQLWESGPANDGGEFARNFLAALVAGGDQ